MYTNVPKLLRNSILLASTSIYQNTRRRFESTSLDFDSNCKHCFCFSKPLNGNTQSQSNSGFTCYILNPITSKRDESPWIVPFAQSSPNFV